MRSVELAVLALAAAAAAGAGAGPRLAATVPGGAVSVGDRVAVSVAAEGGGSGLWGELEVAADGAWAVVEPPRAETGGGPPAWRVVLAPLEVGELALPAMTATLRPADGEPVTVGLEEPPAVTVASVLPPEGEVEPAGIRPPIGARGLPWETLVPGLAVALPVAVLAAWALGRRRRGAPPAGESSRTPLEELEALADELGRLVGREPEAVLCDRLAAGLRTFLERSSGEPAREMTSFELRLLARRAAWPEPVRRGIQRVMAVADGVRFGRRAIAAAELEEALGTAVEVGRVLEAHLRPAAEAAS